MMDYEVYTCTIRIVDSRGQYCEQSFKVGAAPVGPEIDNGIRDVGPDLIKKFRAAVGAEDI